MQLIKFMLKKYGKNINCNKFYLLSFIKIMWYNHQDIEKKRQNFWENQKIYKTPNDTTKPKKYILDMFPYPSWAWLHVWHPKWYTANDIIARYYHAKWYNVLHPMWRDAFGLPAENYAIKTWTHPRITTEKNIQNFKKQIQALWISYDRDREINTTDPKYYKWTQRIFLKMFENWLAYEQDLPINYCPSCKTWLANEEVLNDWTCDRCWTKVEKRPIRQRVLAITKYAERLLNDVDKLDRPEWIKEMQKNRIWKSVWTEFKMKVVDDNEQEIWEISVYTTRIDTVFGMTYTVIAPEHPEILKFINSKYSKECLKYIENAKNKSDLDRTAETKEKTWVFTWSYVINPYNNQKVPLRIGDYVLWNYWTWAVMAVPAHDQRDFEFAKKHNLPIKQVISPNWKEIKNLQEAFVDYWILINSNEFNWLTSEEAKQKLTKLAEEKWFGKQKINYKLRDRIFSRQRYRWEPIPLIHINPKDYDKLERINNIEQAKEKDKAYILEKKNDEYLIINQKKISKIYNWLYTKIIIDRNLPLELPNVEKYEPAWNWESPLANVSDWLFVKLAKNLVWKRETNTMPQRWWSCRYYLRFMDPDNNEKLVDFDIQKYWWAVDSYVWWAEHAVLHLLYARFWHKFLYDIWVVSYDEPFYKLRNQWLILAYAYQKPNWWLVPNDLVEEKNWKYFHKETWEELQKIVAKMSKSLKNTVNPDDIVKEFWADSFRLYEMYLSDFKDSAPRDTEWIIWVRRFLDKVRRNFTEEPKQAPNDNEAIKMLHKSIKKISKDIENYKFNTAIAQLMILINYWLPKEQKLQQERKHKFLILLHPFAPHIAEELYQNKLNITDKKISIFFEPRPQYEENLIKDNIVKIAIQINWKVRSTIEVWIEEKKENIINKAKQDPKIKKYLEWKNIKKTIYIPGKILSFVI